MMDQEFNRSIVVAARRWIGTPYVHQMSACRQGTDCLGLVRGVWREVVGAEPQTTPDYARDWGDVSGNESMLDAAERWFVKIKLNEMTAGNLLLFRWNQKSVVKHAGIYTGNDKFIHAYEKAGVVETSLGSQWSKRIAAVYSFPLPNSGR